MRNFILSIYKNFFTDNFFCYISHALFCYNIIRI